MNNLRNHVLLIGHLGADPVLKELKNDNYVANVSLATNESIKRNDEWVEDTQWHRLVFWGKSATRLAQVAKKGSELVIQGKLKYRSYEDKEGVVRTYAEINVTEFLVTAKSRNKEAQGAEVEPAKPF